MNRHNIERRHVVLGAAALAVSPLIVACASAGQDGRDPLPSWNEGPTKKSITDFMARVTAQGSRELVPPAERRSPRSSSSIDGPGKPVGISRFIGRRPILAFGNSDGDLQMLQWTAAGPGARFMGIVHHTDAQREWAYDRTSHVGKLDKGLDEARQRAWTVVDMKTDWKVVYPFEKE